MSIRDTRKQQSRQALLDAVLHLSTTGRSFSSLSLREVTREVGLTPTAFYRHFQDMPHLGQELIDQVALHLKGILHQLHLADLQQHPDQLLQLFFRHIEQRPQPWIFLIAERWGGCPALRQAIAREIDSLTDDLNNLLYQITSIQLLQSPQELQMFSNILINLALNWAMSWISLAQHEDGSCLQQRQTLHEQVWAQLCLIFHGLFNNQSRKTAVS